MNSFVVAVRRSLVPEENPFSGARSTTILDGKRHGNVPGRLPGEPDRRNGVGDHAVTAIEPLEGGGAVLAELARAVEYDRTIPDHEPANEHATPSVSSARYAFARTCPKIVWPMTEQDVLDF